MPLVAHLRATARIACDLFGRRWARRAKATGLLPSLLPLAALFHDTGKAAFGKARAACLRGEMARVGFYRHEVLPFELLLSERFIEALGSENAVALLIGVVLHHHAMLERLDRPVEDIVNEKVFGDPSKLGETKRAMETVLRLSHDLKGCEDLLELRRLEFGGSVRRAALELVGDSTLASGYVLAGFIAVADTLAASIEACEDPRERYAWRVLVEMRGRDGAERALETFKAIVFEEVNRFGGVTC